VLEELSEAFSSWYDLKEKDQKANPPGYRKRNYYDDNDNLVHEEHPRSTVTWKQQGIKHDSKHNIVRLSKGFNQKQHPSDYILIEYNARDNEEIQDIQQVRTVYNKDKQRWEVHLVCKHEVETPKKPGEETAGIDLGISNFLAISYSTEKSEIYPSNRLKQDEYYFLKEIAKCDDSDSNKARKLHHKRTERRNQFIHSLAKKVVERCVEENVGLIRIGDLSWIRTDMDDEVKNWGKHGNLDLHSWPFDKFTAILEYKAKRRGIEVDEVSERGTSKTCCICGIKDKNQRVERGLYVCSEHGDAFHSDVGGAENIRRNIAEESNSESDDSSSSSYGKNKPKNLSLDEDRCTGWLAQPGVYLYDLSCGFLPQTEVVDCKP
ncbi:MAG: RNA-guided endonuclease InsQ/TnpB family protein, partial [Halobacteria archaeon]